MQFFNRVMSVMVMLAVLEMVGVMPVMGAEGMSVPKVIVPDSGGEMEVSMEEVVMAHLGALRQREIGQRATLDPSTTLARLSVGIVDYFHACGLETSMDAHIADQISWKVPIISTEMFRELQAICKNIVITNREVVSTTSGDILPFSLSFGTKGVWRPRFYDYIVGNLSPTFYNGIWDSRAIEPLEFINRPAQPQCQPIVTQSTENNQFVGQITCDIAVWSAMYTIPRGSPDFCRQTPEKAYCDGNILSIEPPARDEFTTSWKANITTRIIIDSETKMVLIPERFRWFPLRTQYRRR